MEPGSYHSSLNDSITKIYRKANPQDVSNLNQEAKRIAKSLNLDNRIDQLAEHEAFISLKDHKENFANKPVCRQISPTKSDIVQISKHILDKVIKTIRTKTKVNLWKSTRDILQWYNSITDKPNHSFVVFEIVEFYPSITENLLLKALHYADQLHRITPEEINIILHARRTNVFSSNAQWRKKNNDSLFDIAMGSLDGAECCELVVCSLLSLLKPKYGNSLGLYTDDGLGAFNCPLRELENIKKDICKTFRENDLKITAEANKKNVNYLDVTLDLPTSSYRPVADPGGSPASGPPSNFPMCPFSKNMFFFHTSKKKKKKNETVSQVMTVLSNSEEILVIPIQYRSIHS
ncbi:hypothetical protein HOLleu_31977 [Holothuria leucospilota]|uniref:Uncharacterized protein n=1 Tax=Holothuria leucospilota TaxID=206669 RepID=A0A9Q0YSC1_HOLLE|nr:hypothetical protein HOLleu_31977 [Holothuria leucospilota]